MTDMTDNEDWEPEYEDLEDLEAQPDRIRVVRGYTIINAGDERELLDALREARDDSGRVVVGVHDSTDNMIKFVFSNPEHSEGMGASELLRRGGDSATGVSNELIDAYSDPSRGYLGVINSPDFYQVHIFTQGYQRGE